MGLTHALAVELGPLGVRVNAVGPSWFDSPFNTQARTEEERTRIADVQKRMSPLGRHVTPADIANAVAFLASAKAAFITGETIYVAGARPESDRLAARGNRHRGGKCGARPGLEPAPARRGFYAAAPVERLAWNAAAAASQPAFQLRALSFALDPFPRLFVRAADS